MRAKKPTRQSATILEWVIAAEHGRGVHIRADLASGRIQASLRVNGAVAVHLRSDQLKPLLDRWKIVLPCGTSAASLLR
jgi:hypothetical protein